MISNMMLQTVSGDYVMTLGADTTQEVEAVGEGILDRLDEHQVLAYPGTIGQGLKGISMSYQDALNRREFEDDHAAFNYFFPMDWENKLLLCLRDKNNAQTALEILQTVATNNMQRYQQGKMSETDLWLLCGVIREDLKRVMQENGMSKEKIHALMNHPKVASAESMLQHLLASAAAFCGAINEQQEKVNPIATEIVEYIRQHYDESILSGVMLQEVFSLSINTINKYIKDITGETFSGYLTKLRIEKAKELLSTGQWKIPQVAQMVGYDNDYSFRRAFTRFTGCKAQNWGDAQK